ncbi:MAG: ribosome small subunit-dependent GTPase A [Planctomycetaceae bacterium]|nr:ribosome small subunit-dependent GTPase A [Planctomycetaceae bacterium]
MARKKKRQVRVEFRKNRTPRARDGNLTRGYENEDPATLDARQDERLSGKGDLTRKRTVRGVTTDGDAGLDVHLDIDESNCQRGLVVSVFGLTCLVRLADGRQLNCAVRRLLKTLSTDQRHVVVAGDLVLVRMASEQEGIIERIEPRHGVLSRTSRGRRHIIAANVDQWLIVSSAAEPEIKPHLIDRFLVCAEQSGIDAVICINKIDLVDPAKLIPLVSGYSQMGYEVLMVSARSGLNIDRLRRRVFGRQTVITGQSGVGKSSLLNVVEQELGLRVGAVSRENQKGRHTTTTAQVVPLSAGGSVIDTPGLRQFQLWDIVPREVAGYFRDLRPYVNNCRFPDCTHTHEQQCAVKDAVADGWLDMRRYESYQHMFAGDDEFAREAWE